MERMHFARVCVEVDVSAALSSKIRLQTGSSLTVGMQQIVEVDVDYQRKPLLCDTCQQTGHSKNHCKSNRIYRPTGRILPDSYLTHSKVAKEVKKKATTIILSPVSGLFVPSSNPFAVLQENDKVCSSLGNGKSSHAAESRVDDQDLVQLNVATDDSDAILITS
ncbi:hypothetical protein Nepgr_017474 [Nepenthes gracilis]|uniref:Uncharacterized protein n=1 Tax=Nepenthes gracilis TaxID=150966 RepID=A0AAD3SPH0_NEPGR|nr:hypothetical protein Nepgr_017474 [Nepenthes gracilis]